MKITLKQWTTLDKKFNDLNKLLAHRKTLGKPKETIMVHTLVPSEITWDEARRALSSKGWIPLCTILKAEFWKKGSNTCTLIIDCEEQECSEYSPDNSPRVATLLNTRHVKFSRQEDGRLIAHFAPEP